MPQPARKCTRARQRCSRGRGGGAAGSSIAPSPTTAGCWSRRRAASAAATRRAFCARRGEALRMTMSTTWAPRRACELAHGLRQPGPSRKEAAGALSSGEAAGGARRLCRQCRDGDVSNTNSAASRSCPDEMHGQLEHSRAREIRTSTHVPHGTSECQLCAGASPAPSSEKAGGLPGGTMKRLVL